VIEQGKGLQLALVEVAFDSKVELELELVQLDVEQRNSLAVRGVCTGEEQLDSSH
jgi:hypothetical protein